MSLAPTIQANRIEFLKARTLAWEETQRFAIGRRLYHALKGLSATTPATPWMKRKAAILASILADMEAEIGEAELIVGYNYYGSDDGMWMEVPLFKAERPAEVALADEEGLLCAWATPENHTVIGYEQVLRRGFAALRDKIAARLEALDWSDPDSVHRKLLLESTLQVAQAACTLGRRYAHKAAVLLETCPDPMRAAELRAIQEACLQVPEFPARTFHEAVQSLWFVHLINTWEDGINANSLGRIDQILYPYYMRDVAAGRLTQEEAKEILACLWLKLYRDYDVQQATLGGVDIEGRDAANDLTYLMLDVTEELDLIRCLGVRLHKDSPEKLLRRALEIVRRGKGVPFFFNDEALIPALVENGIALQDARNYANIGCIETTIPGKANPHAVSNRVNLLKCLEVALNDGVRHPQRG